MELKTRSQTLGARIKALEGVLTKLKAQVTESELHSDTLMLDEFLAQYVLVSHPQTNHPRIIQDYSNLI